MSFQETWRTNLWVNDSFFHDRLERCSLSSIFIHHFSVRHNIGSGKGIAAVFRFRTRVSEAWLFNPSFKMKNGYMWISG